jgi:quercetin dioxygenase-like cupin family protein
MKHFLAAAVVMMSLSAASAVAIDYDAPFQPIIALGDETRLIYPDFPVEVLATESETNGQFGMVVIYTKPKGGPADNALMETKLTETFYVLDGLYEFTVGEKILKGGPGTVVVNPPNVPHGFKYVGDGIGRLLVIYTPSDGARKGADFFVDWANQSTRWRRLLCGLGEPEHPVAGMDRQEERGVRSRPPCSVTERPGR